MFWDELSTFIKAVQNQNNRQNNTTRHLAEEQSNAQPTNTIVQPSDRWGQASVAAHQRMFIIGGYQGSYLGDVYSMDFETMEWTQHRLEAGGEDNFLLTRSNHTVIFYEKHNSIYVFGGGSAQKQRFNDTLQLKLVVNSTSMPTEFQQQIMSDSDEHNAPQTRFFEECQNNTIFPHFSNKKQNATGNQPQNYSLFPSKTPKEEKLALQKRQHQWSNTEMRVKMVELESDQVPSARTYHASCLLQHTCYMIVIGGESNNVDLEDVWALDLDNPKWTQFTITNRNAFYPKRFHSASSLTNNKVVTFGGCHQDYQHLNDVNVFDFTPFVESGGQINEIDCVKLKFDQLNALVPSSRWGHTACVHENLIYILGGRNEADLSDLYSFDLQTEQFKKIQVVKSPPPRRRHSSVFIASTLLQFGGFDGDFYNDLNALHLNKHKKETIVVGKSTLCEDYASLCEREEFWDLQLQITNTGQKVGVNKSLLLYRLIDRELNFLISCNQQASNPILSAKINLLQKSIPDLFESPQAIQEIPEFLHQIYHATPYSTIDLRRSQTTPETLRIFISFCYSNKILSPITGVQAQQVSNLCFNLHLKATQQIFEKIRDTIKKRIQDDLIQKVQLESLATSHNNSNENLVNVAASNSNNILQTLTDEQNELIKQGIKDLGVTLKFQLDNLDKQLVQSPEENHDVSGLINQNNNFASNSLRLMMYDHTSSQGLQRTQLQCFQTLDLFHDVLFVLDNTNQNETSNDQQCQIPANKAVLASRSEYFNALFSSHQQKDQTYTPNFNQTFDSQSSKQIVRIQGISPLYFKIILQYLYTDQFKNISPAQNTLQFYLLLLIYADYFSITRLIEVCSLKISTCIRVTNALHIFLIAQAHNAVQLERKCKHFIAVNDQKILMSKGYKKLVEMGNLTNVSDVVGEIVRSEHKEDYVEFAINKFMKRQNKIMLPKFQSTIQNNNSIANSDCFLQTEEQLVDNNQNGAVDVDSIPCQSSSNTFYGLNNQPQSIYSVQPVFTNNIENSNGQNKIEAACGGLGSTVNNNTSSYPSHSMQDNRLANKVQLSEEENLIKMVTEAQAQLISWKTIENNTNSSIGYQQQQHKQFNSMFHPEQQQQQSFNGFNAGFNQYNNKFAPFNSLNQVNSVNSVNSVNDKENNQHLVQNNNRLFSQQNGLKMQSGFKQQQAFEDQNIHPNQLIIKNDQLSYILLQEHHPLSYYYSKQLDPARIAGNQTKSALDVLQPSVLQNNHNKPEQINFYVPTQNNSCSYNNPNDDDPFTVLKQSAIANANQQTSLPFNFYPSGYKQQQLHQHNLSQAQFQQQQTFKSNYGYESNNQDQKENCYTGQPMMGQDRPQTRSMTACLENQHHFNNGSTSRNQNKPFQQNGAKAFQFETVSQAEARMQSKDQVQSTFRENRPDNGQQNGN